MNIIVITLLVFLFDFTFQINTKNYETDTKFNYCLNVVKGNCELCQQQYFLFSLPQDHNELGLKAGTRICVECPYLKFNEANNYYCGDCLDNSQTWDKSRLCTYDYKTKSTGTSVFHKIERPAKQLFYTVKSGLQDFATQSCDGCEHFCKSQNSTCLPVSKQFSYDLNNLYELNGKQQILYISCTQGYEYSDVIGGCDPCPENCKSCQINKYISIDDSGKTIVIIKKNCLICNEGFSLLTTRTELNGIETYSQCIACFTGCDTCHFGKDGINLNEKPWDDYNNHLLLLTSNYVSDEIKFFEDLFKQYRVAQRCEQLQQIQYRLSLYYLKYIKNYNYKFYTFVPSLSKRTCVRCGTNCKSCEYKFGSLLPTRDKYKVVEPETTEPTIAEIEAVESPYVLRCRECDKFAQTFYAVGTGCTDCSIVNCKLCAKVGDPTLGSDSSFSTIAQDFEPLTKEEQTMEKCLLCEDGYFLSEDYKLCTIFDLINKPKTGCLTYLRQTILFQHCLQCDIGYTLYKNDSSGYWECRMDCSSLMQDYLCQSCVINGLKQRCLRCLDGFYVDMQTGKCAKCAENGHCKKCFTLSLVSVHHTEYYDYNFDGQANTMSEKKILGPYCYECTPGDAFKGPILNEDLRYCEKGGDNCAQFLARGTKGYCDQCDSSLVSISLSSSIDDSDCIQCPEFTIGCRERSNQEITLFNQFYDPTDDKYKKYARLSYKCDDSGNTYYDSKIGRCISKTDCPTPCDRSDLITIIADCQYKQNQYINYYKINQMLMINGKLIHNLVILHPKLHFQFQKIRWMLLLKLLSLKNGIKKLFLILFWRYNYQIYQFSYNSKCFFQKDTYFTSNIRKNVFSVQELELKIQTNSPTPNERIQWFIQKTIFFAYFTSVSINGIELFPASDRGNLFLNLPKYETPFGFEFLNNTGSKFYLENVKIGNINAEDHYLDKSSYTTPYSQIAVTLKKYHQILIPQTIKTILYNSIEHI